MGNEDKQAAFLHIKTPAIHHNFECMSTCAACAKKYLKDGHLEMADSCDECAMCAFNY